MRLLDASVETTFKKIRLEQCLEITREQITLSYISEGYAGSDKEEGGEEARVLREKEREAERERDREKERYR